MTPPNESSRKFRGQALVEFTFVGIPVLFVLVSIFEISRGMWMYHTLEYAAKTGIRFATVHGINCVTINGNPNACTKTIADTALVIRNAGAGLDLNTTQLQFTPGEAGAASTTCNLAAAGAGGCPALSTNPWPWYDSTFATSPDAVGQPIRIDIHVPFRSALAMFWPGTKALSFSVVNLGASSQDFVQF